MVRGVSPANHLETKMNDLEKELADLTLKLTDLCGRLAEVLHPSHDAVARAVDALTEED